MDLRQLAYFVQVAEVGNFTRAAALLGVAQPALSRQVRQLEVELRQSLLSRNGRGASLTEAGRRLLDHARGILNQVERAREDLEEMRGAPVGHAIVGAPPSVARNLASPLVDRFKERFPKATLGIVEGLSTYVLEWLASGRIDIGLVYNPVPSRLIETTPLVSEPLFLIGPCAVPARKPRFGAPIALRDLPRHGLIVPSQPHAVRMHVETQLASVGARINVALEIDGIPSILDLVAQGHGYAVLPINAIRHHPLRLSLVPRPIVRPRLSIGLMLATSSQRPLTPLARETVKLAAQLAQSRLSQPA
ncbi:MAG TPA: LysR family transcriptional regulator [Usitatibacter sp.]|nr:LysR family transcriptional regulator [Usitatibacter sp.]